MKCLLKYFLVGVLVVLANCDGKSDDSVVVPAGVEDIDNGIQDASNIIKRVYVNNADGLLVKTDPDMSENYEGVYKFKSINIEIEDGAYVKNHLADKGDIYVKIICEIDKTYSIEFSIEAFRGEAQVCNDKVGSHFSDIFPFYKYWAEMGGGGTYMDFYYNDGMILVKYHRLYSYPITELSWEGDVEKEELKFELLLEKYENLNGSP